MSGWPSSATPRAIWSGWSATDPDRLRQFATSGSLAECMPLCSRGPLVGVWQIHRTSRRALRRRGPASSFRSNHTRGCQDSFEAARQDPVAALPHRRRRLPHQAGRTGHRGDRQVSPQERPVGDRGRTPSAPSTGSRSAPSPARPWSPCSSAPVTGRSSPATPRRPGSTRSRRSRTSSTPSTPRWPRSAVTADRPTTKKAAAKTDGADGRGHSGRGSAGGRRRSRGRETARGLTCSPTRWSTWSAGLSATPTTSTVKDKDLRHGRMLEVRVNPDDIGKVIGRSGRTATALRTVVSALAGRESVRVDFVDVDRQPRRGNGGGRGRRPDRTRRDDR